MNSPNLSFRFIHSTGQLTPKMKANAVPRLLSSLVWIDQYYEWNGMTSFMEFMICTCQNYNISVTYMLARCWLVSVTTHEQKDTTKTETKRAKGPWILTGDTTTLQSFNLLFLALQVLIWLCDYFAKGYQFSGGDRKKTE